MGLFHRWTWESGCQLIETTDDFITCSCNHLTSFSAVMVIYDILLDRVAVPRPVTSSIDLQALCASENKHNTGCPCKEQDEDTLSWISLTGCVISAVALLLTILILIIDI